MTQIQIGHTMKRKIPAIVSPTARPTTSAGKGGKRKNKIEGLRSRVG